MTLYQMRQQLPAIPLTMVWQSGEYSTATTMTEETTITTTTAATLNNRRDYASMVWRMRFDELSIEVMHSFESEWVVRLRIRNRYAAFHVLKRQQNEQKSNHAMKNTQKDFTKDGNLFCHSIYESLCRSPYTYCFTRSSTHPHRHTVVHTPALTRAHVRYVTKAKCIHHISVVGYFVSLFM